MTETSATLHDQLQLEQLEKQIEVSRHHRRRFRIYFAFMIVYYVFLTSFDDFIVNVLLLVGVDRRFLVMVLYPIPIILLSIYYLFIAISWFRNRVRRLSLANTLLLQLIPALSSEPNHPPRLTATNVVVSLFLIGVVVGIGIVRADLLQVVEILLIPVIIFFLSRAVLSTTAIAWLYRGPLSRADYDGALQRVKRLQRWGIARDSVAGVEVMILLFAGKDKEAELKAYDVIKRAKRNPVILSVTICNLGFALLRQNHYSEALPFLENSIRITPELGSLYNGLAEFYLSREIEPERVLELTEFALKRMGRPKSNLFLQRTEWCWLKGSEAVAAALTGRDTRANSAIMSALTEAAPNFMPGLAGVHVSAGAVRRIQGNVEEARQHFERALQLDPQGAVGKNAELALHDLNTASE